MHQTQDFGSSEQETESKSILVAKQGLTRGEVGDRITRVRGETKAARERIENSRGAANRIEEAKETSRVAGARPDRLSGRFVRWGGQAVGGDNGSVIQRDRGTTSGHFNKRIVKTREVTRKRDGGSGERLSRVAREKQNLCNTC
jgi:hypothetical protein